MTATTAPLEQVRRDCTDAFRDADRALRGIRRNGGTTGATTGAVARHERMADWATTVLLNHGERELAGLLADEAFTAERLRVANLLGQTRPELLARQRNNRRAIRRLLAAA